MFGEFMVNITYSISWPTWWNGWISATHIWSVYFTKMLV